MNQGDFKVVAKPMYQHGCIRVAAVKVRVHVTTAGQKHAIYLFFFQQGFNLFGADGNTGRIWPQRYKATAGRRHYALVSRICYAYSAQKRVVQRERNTRGVCG